MNWPKISIVTVSFNQGDFLEETILSVLNQRYPNLEYIIIDGGSRDNSVEIIRKYAHRLAYWVSEPDQGQTYGINKGLEKVTGDIVAFVNSDDVYLPGALKAVADAFIKHPDWNWLVGGWLIFGQIDDLETSCWLPRPPANAADCLYQHFSAAQPGHFWRGQLFKQYGLLDSSYHFCFDHEFYARLLVAGETCHGIQVPLAAYRFHNTSKTVSAADRFTPEFTRIREKYLPKVSVEEAQRARREYELQQSFLQCREAVRLLEVGERDAAWDCFTATVTRWPTSLSRRFGWGCLRRLLS